MGPPSDFLHPLSLFVLSPSPLVSLHRLAPFSSALVAGPAPSARTSSGRASDGADRAPAGGVGGASRSCGCMARRGVNMSISNSF